MAQRWLVWLGALALGLGALFVAGWAVEQGLVGPQVRVLGAALLGFALLALGERARRGQAARERPRGAGAGGRGPVRALRRGAGGAPRLRAGRAGRRLPAAGAGLGPGCCPGPAVRAAGRAPGLDRGLRDARLRPDAGARGLAALPLPCRCGGRPRGAGAALGPGGGRLGGVGRGGGVGGRVAGRGGARQAAGRLPGGAGAAPAGAGARRDRGAVPAPPGPRVTRQGPGLGVPAHGRRRGPPAPARPVGLGLCRSARCWRWPPWRSRR